MTCQSCRYIDGMRCRRSRASRFAEQVATADKWRARGIGADAPMRACMAMWLKKEKPSCSD